jgi:hypothetical protein
MTMVRKWAEEPLQEKIIIHQHTKKNPVLRGRKNT